MRNFSRVVLAALFLLETTKIGWAGNEKTWTLAAEYRTWFMLNPDSDLPNIIQYLKGA